MQRNQKKLLAFSEFEDAMQFLLSRSLWDAYAQHADDLVSDFVSLTGLVSKESLQALESTFQESKVLALGTPVKSAASSFLGRFWSGSTHGFSKSGNSLVLTPPASLPLPRKVTSGQSLTSTLNSFESTSEASTLATEITNSTKGSEHLFEGTTPTSESGAVSNKDRDLHHQIEDLLTALSDMQRQQSDLMRELQREREERDEDRETGKALLESLQKQASAIRDLVGGEVTDDETHTEALLSRASNRFCLAEAKRISIVQTKHQLRDAVTEWKQKHDLESARCQDLMKQLDEREVEHGVLREQLREARSRIQDAHREKQRLERTVQDLRTRKSPVSESPTDGPSPISEPSDMPMSSAKPGLREFKLGRSEPPKTSTSVSKRSSSLTSQSTLATEGHRPLTEDALLLELVNAKTAEAVAKQELEETKGKLEALRKILIGPAASPTARGTDIDNVALLASASPGAVSGQSVKALVESTKPAATTASTTGFFSGWGKRNT